jgi:phosphate starvation-inducible protein PhoH
LRNKNKSALEVVLSRFDRVKDMGVVKMSEKDINIRNLLINLIEDEYNKHKTNGN